MKILVSSGIKTVNIINALKSKLESKGIDFISVPYIEDITEIFSKGEYFDRAIIVEYSWTHDDNDKDDYSIRNKINNFSDTVSKLVSDNTSFMMVSKTNDMAEVISEEIIAINTRTALVVKEPTYTVNFFIMLSTYEIRDIPEKYMYVPSDLVDETTDSSDEQLNVEYQNNFRNTQNEDNNANLLPIDQGLEDTDYNDSGWSDTQESSDDGDWNPDELGFEELAGILEQPQAQDNDNNSQEENWDPENGSENINWYPEQQGFEEVQQWDDNQDKFDTNQDIFDDTQDNWDPQQQGFEEVQEWDDKPDGFEEVQEWDDNPDGFEEVPSDEWDNIQDIGEETFDESNIDLNKHEDEVYDESPSGEIPDYSDYSDDQYNQQEEPYQDEYNQEEYDQEQPENMYEDAPSGEIPDYSDYSNNEYVDDEQPDDGYDQSMYEDNQEEPQQPEFDMQPDRTRLTNKQIQDAFRTFAAHGTSILVTGCGGCGTSLIAFNLANTLVNLGYNVLLVDMDTENKTQSYISKDNFESMDADSAGIMAAVNSTTSNLNANIAIVRQGFHLLTMGMASDSITPDKAFKLEKIQRFVSQARNTHQFIIYDIPFHHAVNELKDVILGVDNIVITVDASNWGVAKTLINMCNISSEEVTETLFSRGQLLFNRFRGIRKIFNSRIRQVNDITKLMDKKVETLTGDSTGYLFKDMKICGVINESPDFENGWFSNIQISDTQAGFDLFSQLLQDIIIRK